MKIAITLTFAGALMTGWVVWNSGIPVYSTGKPESILAYCERNFGFTPEHTVDICNGQKHIVIRPQVKEV